MKKTFGPFMNRVVLINQLQGRAQNQIPEGVKSKIDFLEEYVRLVDVYRRVRDDLDKQERELSEELARIRNRKSQLLRCAWLSNILMPDPTKPYVLSLSIMPLTDAAKTTLPVVLVNDLACGHTVVKKTKDGITLDVNIEPVLATAPEVLSVRLQESEDVPELKDEPMQVFNPYLIKQEWFEKLQCAWQCEGHAKEKHILLEVTDDIRNTLGQFLMISAKFDLLADGHLLGTFVGSYPVEHAIFIPTPSINKSQCVGKRMELRLHHTKGVKKLLPPPVVMTVDYKPVEPFLG